MRLLTVDPSGGDRIVADHVAVPGDRPGDRAWVRLNMIESADGGSTVAGVSGGLGNRDDHEVFAALRTHADACVVGMSTVAAEHYRPPGPEDPDIFVVAPSCDVGGARELFASDRVTLVVPERSGPAPAGVRDLRMGTGSFVDLALLLQHLAGKVVLSEGGPSLAGALVAQGLLDEFFVTVAPRVVAGTSARVVHGGDADPAAWDLVHGFCDDDGFLFLRYGRRPA